MDYDSLSLIAHRQHCGKLGVTSLLKIDNKDDLSVAYTPGVAAVCRAIVADPSQARELTIAGRTVAIITDGSAVLGLGNIGALAGLPVMEGKAELIVRFAGLNAYPICLATQDVGEIIQAVKMIAQNFAAICLEDISAPRCFEVERELKAALPIPVMHDDQHGTAVVILAALTNALRVVGKNIEDVRLVISGVGAAGVASANLLAAAGAQRIDLVDTRGLIAVGRLGMNPFKDELAARFNPAGRLATMAELLVGADVFIGVSAPGIVTADMVRTMATEPIVFAMSNPMPEIMPDEALAGGAAVIATGRSDFANQVNNVLAFPGIFRGVIAARARQITQPMLLAAAHAIAGLVPEPKAACIVPSPFDPGVAEAVAAAVQSEVK
jgi:malate dehydrogenase (oxaloacetate-decarboxylating)